MSPIRSFSKRWAIEIAVGALLMAGARASAGERPRLETVVHAPCTPREKWEMGPLASVVSLEAQQEFTQFLSGQRAPYAAFAEVTGLEESFKDSTAKAFGEYWLGRALFSAGLHSEAGAHFNHLITLTPTRLSVSIQLAAMACLQEIHQEAPQVRFSKEALANVPNFYEPWLVAKRDLPFLWEATVHYALGKIRENDAGAVESALVMLGGSGPYEPFVQGLWAVRQDKMKIAALALKQLLAEDKLPVPLQNRRSQLSLLLASAYYATGKYAEAVERLEGIGKQSNELVPALALLSSTRLLTGDQSKAIGTAVGLRSGAFRNTFVPEIYSTASMALAEFCRYPEALSNLSDFRREYQSAYRWLKRQRTEKDEPLYPKAIAYLKGSDSGVPSRVASEWIRSPVFIAHQATIHRLLSKEQRMSHLAAEPNLTRLATQKELAALRATAPDPKSGANPSLKSLDAVLTKKNLELLEARLKHLEAARGAWKTLLSQREAIAEKESAALEVAIEGHLRRMNERMLQQLNRLVDNHELIEAELLAASGQDMVLQSGKTASQSESSGRDPAGGAWRVTDDLGGSEIWIDELGTIEANVTSGCVQKEPHPKSGG